LIGRRIELPAGPGSATGAGPPGSLGRRSG